MTDAPAIDVALIGGLGAFRMNVAFRAPMRGVTALFGPSGCGKTTILRCIAGLERVAGRISIAGEAWQDTAGGVHVPTHQRHVGYVFQEASLFPHLSVRGNLEYGTRRARASASRDVISSEHRAPEFDAVVGLLGIGHLLERAPANLSGGERQRVAVGRALLSNPRLLLMDEPLSALDRMTKLEILPYLEKLHETLAVPMIYVSHDLNEVERLADTLVLLEAGHVLAAGPLYELQTNTSLPLIAAPEASVVLEGRVAAIDAEFALSRLAIPGGELIVTGHAGELGAVRRLRVGASDVSIARTPPTGSTILNCLPARIVSIDSGEGAPQANVLLALGADGEGSRVGARVTRKSVAALGLRVGDSVYAQIKSVALIASRASRADATG